MEILPKKSDPAYVDKLISLLASTKEWENKADFALQMAVEGFMKALGPLYLDYFQYHIEEAKVCALDYQERLPYLVTPINRLYINNMWLSLKSASEWEDPWERACWIRTNIEAFQMMFGDVAGRLDDADIIEYMDEMKGSFGLTPDQVPQNAPQSFWWWYEEY